MSILAKKLKGLKESLVKEETKDRTALILFPLVNSIIDETMNLMDDDAKIAWTKRHFPEVLDFILDTDKDNAYYIIQEVEKIKEQVKAEVANE